MTIRIGKGGCLYKIQWEFEPSEQEGRYVCIDITNDLPSFLFHACEIEEGATLKDIFLLIKKHLEFLSVVLPYWVDEFVDECLGEEEQDEEIAYLELYWHLENDGEKITGLEFPCFQGVDKEGKAWSISLMSVGHFANIPVKVSDTLSIITHTGDKWNTETQDNPTYTLGHILYGIVWEISYYGPPKKRDKLLKMMGEEWKNELDKICNSG